MRFLLVVIHTIMMLNCAVWNPPLIFVGESLLSHAAQAMPACTTHHNVSCHVFVGNDL